MIDENLSEKLSDKLDTRVEIEEIEVNWLNQVALNNVVIFDQANDTLFRARRAMIALEVVPLLEKKLIINTIQLIDFHLTVSRDSITAKPNYAFLLEAIMPHSDQSNQRKFINDISLHSLLLRQGSISYDILDRPAKGISNVPDPSHIYLTDLSASLAINVSHITGLHFTLKRMRLKEKCGLSLDELSAKGSLNGDSIDVWDINTILTKPMVTGDIGHLEICGDFHQRNGVQMIDLQSIDFNARHKADVHSRLHLSLNSDSVRTAIYKMDFMPSYVNGPFALKIAQSLNHPIDSLSYSLLYDIESLNWEGSVSGISDSLHTYCGTVSSLGDLEGSADIDMKYFPNAGNPLIVDAEGTLAKCRYNNYSYRNIGLKCSYLGDEIHGSLNILDPNCKLKGFTDILIYDSAVQVKGIADIKHIVPNALHILDYQQTSDIALRGVTSFDIKIPDNIDKALAKYDFNALPHGHIHADSLAIISSDEQIEVGTMRLSLEQEENTLVFAFVSSLANIVGTPTSLIGYIPANQQMARILKLAGEPQKDITFQAEWDSTTQHIHFDASMPEWTKDANTYSIHINGNGKTKKDSPMPTYVEANAKLKLQTPKHQLGSLLSFNFDPDPVQLKVLPSTIIIDDKQYKTSSATITQDENDAFRLHSLQIQEDKQNLSISGTFGELQDIDLQMQLENWQLDSFFDLLQKGYLNFGGYATGLLSLKADPTLRLKSDGLLIDQFSYIGTTLGTNNLTAVFDLNSSHLAIQSDIESYPGHHTNIDCDIRLHDSNDSIDLKFELDSLPLDFLTYWIGGVLKDLKGHGSGDVLLFGDVDSLNLLGTPQLHNVAFSNEMLGARFYISDTINMTSDASGRNGFIGLDNVTVKDRNGQEAILTLDIEHHHLHDMEYGMDIDIPESANGFLVFDHPTQKQGELYWGQLWATGRCQMHGNYNHHRISMQASTAGKSIFNLSPGEENFTDNAYNFLTFRDKKAIEEEEANTSMLQTQTIFEKKEDNPTYIEADLLIHANDHCQVYVQMDPLAEDRLVCKGTGDLSLHYDPHHDINLTGNYDISSGSYTVTMKGDFMTKAFKLQNNSHVFFPGSPSDAELDLKAIYNIPSANLNDLDESFSTIAGLSRTTLPVDCKLNVTGQITTPQIAFDLEIKNASDEVQALVHNIIGTQEMLNREVFYLLLFSKFYTPEYASTSQRQTGSELTSFASSSLTSQLNNLLGHMSDNFTLGTNFRSDKGDFSDMEMDVSVSTSLLNERLLMTGNLGYRDAEKNLNMNNQARTFIGDFDVEFLINTRGTVRAKAYSHYNDRDYSINNALTTQGIGIVLRKDFKNLKDLLKRKQEIAK